MIDIEEPFLAKWITGDISAEEEARFKRHPDYKKYQKIKQASNNLAFEEYKIDKAFNELENKINNKKSKVIPLYTWIASVAACAVLLIGFIYFNKSTTYKNNIAQSSNVTLPDGSIMVLNALSSAKVDVENWNKNRSVSLKGEAFFKVKKGSTFTVNTNLGNIKVLGTQFSVNTVANQLITVKCFEGKVRVETKNGKALLTKGMAFQDNNSSLDNWFFTDLKPNWLLKKETTLYKMPISKVLVLLKRQYNIKIQNQELLEIDKLFTGSFTNENLEKALYSVFGVLGVNYELISENEIRILSE